MTKELNQTETAVLLGILRRHPNAYGVSISDEIQERTGRTVPMASIYLTLERLEAKGYVKSRQGAPSAERGGRAKTMFEITGKGQHALNASLFALDRLRSGLKLAGATS